MSDPALVKAIMDEARRRCRAEGATVDVSEVRWLVYQSVPQFAVLLSVAGASRSDIEKASLSVASIAGVSHVYPDGFEQALQTAETVCGRWGLGPKEFDLLFVAGEFGLVLDRPIQEPALTHLKAGLVGAGISNLSIQLASAGGLPRARDWAGAPGQNAYIKVP